MKKIAVFIMVLLFSTNLMISISSASDHLDKADLENVTISLLHPTVVQSLKKHYGGLTQFENFELVKIVPRQTPADLKEDSAFKTPGSVYDITVQLVAIVGEGKKDDVTIILSNEFSKNGFDVVSFETN